VEEKTALMKKLGKRQLTLLLPEPLSAVPAGLSEWDLSLAQDGSALVYRFDSNAESTGIPALLQRMATLGISFKDLATEKSSLEEIFVKLVEEAA
jgi:ABC-2 type transport system ATP-binding protein